MDNLSHHTSQINGISYTYTEIGEGEVFILIPGTLGDEYLFEEVQQGLADRLRVLVFDHLPISSFDDVVDYYHRIFTEILGLTKFHLGGTSVGGWIAQHFTSRYPELVQSLVIGNSFSDNSILREQSLKIYKISRFVPWIIFKRIFEKNVRKSLHDYDTEIIEYFIQSLTSMKKTNLRMRLWWSLAPQPALGINQELPKLIIYTKDDSVVSYDVTEKLIQHYPEAKISTIETGNHYPYKTNPNPYITALQTFFDRNDQS